MKLTFFFLEMVAINKLAASIVGFENINTKNKDQCKVIQDILGLEVQFTARRQKIKIYQFFK